MSAKKVKAIELGMSLMKKGDFDKRAFLETYTALNQQETALILGCRPRDVKNHLKPDFYVGERPKYLVASVRARQQEMISQTEKIHQGGEKYLKAA